MSEKEEKLYVDVRFRFKRNTEVWYENGEQVDSYDYITLDSVSRQKVKGIEEDELQGVGESFGQMDSYQFFLQSEVPQVLVEGGKLNFRS